MRTEYVSGTGHDPFMNLATEEYLMEHVDEDTCILYLWQNRQTVVIGRNQNCFSECNVSELERDGGHLARRLSGGGAVYHDLGNLNFTFLMHSRHYDLDRQLNVILKAVSAAGIKAEKSGRNDITADGRKFSGNAFYHRNGRSCHHGTLLIDVDGERVARYLNVPEDKLKAKGVKSVRSRITNLKEHAPALTIESMMRNLRDAFAEEYDARPDVLSVGERDAKQLMALYRKYASADWRYGQTMEFGVEMADRFAWGGVDIRLKVNNGLIADAVIFSDAMDADLIAGLPEYLKGVRASAPEMSDALGSLAGRGQTDAGGSTPNTAIIEDIRKMILERRL